MHQLDIMIRQRVFGVADGYEDFNDYEALRYDQALQKTLGEEDVLAGKSTLCRIEHNADRQAMVKALEGLWLLPARSGLLGAIDIAL